MATMPAGSVQCCVTSPPYFGLRDYGHDGQIGLEPTPDEFVAAMVAVFREVRRVLRDDGTCWLNLGDSYAGSWGNQGRKETRGTQRPVNGGMLTPVHDGRFPANGSNTGKIPDGSGLKPKDLIGIPWMVAFALRADGWFLRSEIIWAKKNPMPESVTDRPTKAHEQVFLLTKRPTYFYDAAAVAEEGTGRSPGNKTHKGVTAFDDGDAHHRTKGGLLNVGASETRNRRSVWHIASQPFSGSHFATMPPDLAEICIKAGTSERGQCPHCAAPWQRVVETERFSSRPNCRPVGTRGNQPSLTASMGQPQQGSRGVRTATTGWAASCVCPAHQPVPQMVLDPFGGAGTTALVADRLQRNATIIELNPAYAELARNRVNDEAGMFAPVAAE
jgi:DNA modification methylase